MHEPVKTIPIPGFDPHGDPEIRLMDDGSMYLVFNFMPPSWAGDDPAWFDTFDKMLQQALGVDVLWEDREFFLIRSPLAGTEERIALKNIINVGFSTMTNPERVTLTLREPCSLGKEVTFNPPRRFLTLSRSPIIGELIERVDRARKQAR